MNTSANNAAESTTTTYEARRIAPIHPGQIVWRRFIEPSGLTQVEFSDKYGIEKTKLNRLIKGTKAIDVALSRELGRALGVNPRFFLDLQLKYLEAQEASPGAFQGIAAENDDIEQEDAS